MIRVLRQDFDLLLKFAGVVAVVRPYPSGPCQWL